MSWKLAEPKSKNVMCQIFGRSSSRHYRSTSARMLNLRWRPPTRSHWIGSRKTPSVLCRDSRPPESASARECSSSSMQWRQLTVLLNPSCPSSRSSLLILLSQSNLAFFFAYTIDEALKLNIEDKEESSPSQRHTTCRTLPQGRRWLAGLQGGSCTRHRDPRQGPWQGCQD